MSAKKVFAGSQPLPSYNFLVFIDILKIPFSKISSLEIGLETEVLVEGGENGAVHSLFKPASSEKVLTLERGVDTGEGVSGISGANANTTLSVGSRFQFIIIAVMDQSGHDPKKIYVATDVILKKRRLSDLNAMSGEVFVESLEFVYKRLTELPDDNAFFKAFQIIS